MPVLRLTGTNTVATAAEANAAVRAIKDAIGDFLVGTGVREIHLFYAGPSHVALFLGHRLNATAPVRCYEWVGPGRYQLTCRLYADSAEHHRT
jgi:hypothetical protein